MSMFQTNTRTMRTGFLILLTIYLTAVTLAISPKIASAADAQIETVDESSRATQNSLLILSDPDYALNSLGVNISQGITATGSNIKSSNVSRYITDGWARGYDRQYAWTASELNSHLISYISADLGAVDANGLQTSSYVNDGFTFSIDPDRAWSDGDSWSATFTYPAVGLYNGTVIGARLSMSGQYGRTLNPLYDPANGAKVGGEYVGKARFDFAYPMVQLPNLFYAGGYIYNAYNVSMTIEFFDAETLEAVEMLNDDTHASYLSFNSQNYFPYNSITGAFSSLGSYDSWIEDLWIPKDNTTRIETIAGGNMTVVDKGDYYAAIPTSDDFTDVLGGETYNYNRTTVYQKGTFSFLLPRRDSCLSGWFSFDSSSVGTSRPSDPTKTVNRAYPTVGDTVTWTIGQQVHSLGETIGARYQSFVFTDVLPDELNFKSAKMYSVVDGKKTDITSSAGKLSVSGKSVTYTFSSSYLSGMPMEGETYQLVVETTVNSTAANDTDVYNTATVQINDWSLDVSAKTHPSWIELSKKWVNDNASTRPSIIAVNVQSTQGATYAASATLSANQNWRTTVSVPRYREDGTVASYTISEVVPEGYKQEVSGDAVSGYVITNSLINTTSATITATKKLDGKQPGSGYSFQFDLEDTDSRATIQSTTSNDEGEIAFAPITYTVNDLGEHHYQIHEVDDELADIAYDSHYEALTVYVTEGTDGKLDCDIDYDEDGALFENATIKPVMMPLTGESGLLALAGCGLAAITLAVGAGHLIAHRRKNSTSARPQWRPFDD